MKTMLLIICLSITFAYCTKNHEDQEQSENIKTMLIDKKIVENVTVEMLKKFGKTNRYRIENGVKQAAFLWRDEDGNVDEFKAFCINNFINDKEELNKVFFRLSENFETLWGHLNKISLDLNRPLHLASFDKNQIDEIFGAFDPSSHLQEDLFRNKIAFFVILNFPHYDLKMKIENGDVWSRQEWAYAMLGEIFTSRVPAELLQNRSKAMTNADIYISEYNIYMGKLIDKNGLSLFPQDLKLISHWGLRDELKSHYADIDSGVNKQNIIYEVMKRIITQEIPNCIINNKDYDWDPYSNSVFDNGKVIKCESEPNTRYRHILNNFNAVRAIDDHSPNYPTYINRKFEQEFELPQSEVEKLFSDFVSSTHVKNVAKIIEKRLGRTLEPFDIWYDGFKARSSINESDLDKITKKKYPDPDAVKKDLPNIMTKLGFSYQDASRISSRIEVDPSRGAGHAWGSQMKSENAHLRTRIGENGMDYKGYNIAVHEFGHNVEQTITLNDVDYYMLSGVPNTAFTEAWAFVFQKRDMDLLGQKEENPNKHDLMVLDNFWSTYEIMGVSLVDMNLWKWLYENPDADPEEVKKASIRIAKEIWNKYYADVFGIKDQPILAIYSHMIDYPLYLSAYPIGHLIEFQIESYIGDKNLGEEMIRMCKQGRLIPQLWMKNAVGNELSIQPTLDATKLAIENMKKSDM